MSRKANVPGQRDVVIIGGGHNGLVTAFYLAKAGYKPLVLERRAQSGGCAITEEFHPGFRCSTLAHSAGPLRRDIVRDMHLEKHGLNMIKTGRCGDRAVTRRPRAHSLPRHRKSRRRKSRSSLRRMRRSIPEFQSSLAKMGRVIGKALTLAPPDIDNPSFRRSVGNAQYRPRPPQTGPAATCTACCAGGRWRWLIW